MYVSVTDIIPEQDRRERTAATTYPFGRSLQRWFWFEPAGTNLFFSISPAVGSSILPGRGRRRLRGAPPARENLDSARRRVEQSDLKRVRSWASNQERDVGW